MLSLPKRGLLLAAALVPLTSSAFAVDGAFLQDLRCDCSAPSAAAACSP